METKIVVEVENVPMITTITRDKEGDFAAWISTEPNKVIYATTRRTAVRAVLRMAKVKILEEIDS